MLDDARGQLENSNDTTRVCIVVSITRAKSLMYQPPTMISLCAGIFEA